MLGKRILTLPRRRWHLCDSGVTVVHRDGALVAVRGGALARWVSRVLRHIIIWREQ